MRSCTLIFNPVGKVETDIDPWDSSQLHSDLQIITDGVSFNKVLIVWCIIVLGAGLLLFTCIQR